MKMKIFLIATFFLFSVVAASAQQNKPKQSQTKSKTSPQYVKPKSTRPLPFSEVVRVGDTLYLAGQIGTDENFELVSGGIKAETKQIMDKIRRILDENNSSLDHVVKCTVMLADMSEWATMNEIYVTYFKSDRLPARSALGVNGLARGARVEIECIAVVK
jgi:reactive intermediate/imine deaminase